MKWSKLKALVENKIAPSMSERFSINSTAYGNCSCGHAWITLDKEVVANFCTRAFWNRSPSFDQEKKKFVAGEVPEGISKKYEKQLTEYGELSRQDAYQACWEFVHDLSAEQALASDDPLIQTLAVLDSRVGKRRLLKIDAKELHPLASKMLSERALVEGFRLTSGSRQGTAQSAAP